MTDTTTLQPELLDVTMWDDSTSSLRLFAPSVFGSSVDSSLDGDAQLFPLIVIWPGWGMGSRYYDPIGRELASRGYPVVSGELHGQGSSTARATRTHAFGYHHMAAGDFPDTIRAAKEYFGLPMDHPTFFLCHSMGGQVASIFAARPQAQELGLRGVMGVGTGSPDWRGFTGKSMARLRWGTYQMWLMVKLFGYQPEGRLDLAGYGRQSGGHFKEWHRFVHTNRLHDLLDQDMDYEEAKKHITIPFLLTRYEDDDDCTIKSCENLAVSLPSSMVEIEELPEKLGHNSWARNPMSTADRLEQFIFSVGGEGTPTD